MKNSKATMALRDFDLSARTPYVLAIFRIAFGVLFLQHGTMKIFHIPEPTRAMHLTLFPGLMSAIMELAGGVLIAAGLWTRPVAFVLFIEMVVAYFYTHAPKGAWPISNGGELALVYAFGFLYLTYAGGGRWSVDAAFGSDAG